MQDRRIWKFPLEITDKQVLSVPFSFRPLSVQFQDDELVLWALVMPHTRTVERTVWVLGTGNPVPEEVPPNGHIGTVQEESTGLVWHVFYE